MSLRKFFGKFGKFQSVFGGDLLDGRGRKNQTQFLIYFIIGSFAVSALVVGIFRDTILAHSVSKIFLILIAVLHLAAWILLRQRKLNLAMRIIVVGYWVTSTLLVLASGGLESPWLLTQFAVIVLGVLLLGRLFGLLIMALNLVINIGIYYLHGYQNLPLALGGLGLVENLASVLINTTITSFIIVFAMNLLYQSVKRGQVNDSRYRSLFEMTNDAVLLFDTEQRYVNVNQQAAKLLGYEVDELIGMRISDVVVPEERNNAQERIRQLSKDRVIPVYERRVVCKDGSRKTVEVNVALISDDKGKPLYYQSIVRDVSERKQIERELEMSLHEMETMAMHDELTGLLNRRAIMDHAEAEWHRSAREQRPMCVVMVDVDNLKKINDTEGHLAGDQALISVGKAIADSKRPYDWAGRWGGDEFLLVLPGANLVEAAEVADRIRKKYEAENSSIRGAQHISQGVACFPGREKESNSVASVLSQADEALYDAKQRGKNQVGIFRDKGN